MKIKRYAAGVEYFGTKYKGWQIQKSTDDTIQSITSKIRSATIFGTIHQTKDMKKINKSFLRLVAHKKVSNNLLNDFTALENVLIPLVNNGFSLEESTKKANKILSLVNLNASGFLIKVVISRNNMPFFG